MAKAAYGTAGIERLEEAAARCKELARVVVTRDGAGRAEAMEALEHAIGLHGRRGERSFAAAATDFEDGAGETSAYERGIDLIHYACGEGPDWFYEAQRESYATMLATVFGRTRDEVMRDVARVRASYEAIDRIECELM